MSSTRARPPGTASSGVVRVTVTSGTRRVDLVVPAAVPVAELVPELSRSVGLLEADVVHDGYRLLTVGGRTLCADLGLSAQGVEDGGLLTVAPGMVEPSPPPFDDIADAMAALAGSEQPWSRDVGRRVAQGAGGLLVALGAVALHIQHGWSAAGWAAALLSSGLVGGAVLLSRGLHDGRAAGGVSWLAVGGAAVAGYAAVPGRPLVGAGGAALAAGLVALVGLREGRPLAIGPTVVGAVLLLTGLASAELGLDVAVVPTSALVVVVSAGSLFPWLALATTLTHTTGLGPVAEPGAAHEAVDLAVLEADAGAAREILAGAEAGVGLLLLVVAPFAVSLGMSGTLVAVLACLVVLLRTRQRASWADVLVGTVSAVLGVVSVAAAALVLHPEWRGPLGLALVTTGAAALAAGAVPVTASVRRDWLYDLAATSASVAMLPLLVVATGLLDAVRS